MSDSSRFRTFYHLALLSALATGLGCTSADEKSAEPPDTEAAASTTTATLKPPSHEELANMTFGGIVEEPVQLVDGTWEGEPFVEGGASKPTVGLVDDFLLAGDLTGDGNDESVALLWTTSGGSGTFDYIAAAAREGQAVSMLGTAELGDRVKVRAGRIFDGRIELDVLQGGPEDAACCPSQLVTRFWTLGPDGLTEDEAEITGALSIASLQGPVWLLTNFSRDEKAPAGPEVTMILEEGRMSGGSGCNRYFCDVEETGDIAGEISVGAVGGTRMMCSDEVMAVEDRFLRQLAGVTSYSFLAGKLVFNWQAGDDYGTMIFTPRQP